MLADVVQANTHINALIGFVVVQLYRLEGGPRAILPQQSHKFEFSGRGARPRVVAQRLPIFISAGRYRYLVLTLSLTGAFHVITCQSTVWPVYSRADYFRISDQPDGMAHATIFDGSREWWAT